MQDQIEDFNEYINFFKEQPLKEKQKIVFDQLKMLAAFTSDLCKSINVKNDIIINNDVADLNNSNYTEDDFAEAVITLVNSVQNSICDYSNGITTLLDSALEDTPFE